MSSAELWYEDLVPGRVFDLGTTVVDGGEMRDFARRYDPQWYHVDEERAAASEYGGLIASGWLTAALWMRLYADAVLARADAHAAPGVEELRWLATVHAGDVLRGRLEVLGRAPSASRPGRGTVTLLGELHRGTVPVLRCRFRGWFGVRQPAQSS
jgi:acyl dehydratase